MPDALLAATVALAYAAAAFVGRQLLAEPDAIALFWPAAAVAAGACLSVSPRRRAAVAVGVAVATLAANLTTGASLRASVVFACANATEPLVVAAVAWRGTGAPALDDIRDLGRLLLGALLGCVTAAAIGVLGLALVGQAPAFALRTWALWAAADLAGVVSIAPMFLWWFSTRRAPPSWTGFEALVWLGLWTGVLAVDLLWMSSGGPWAAAAPYVLLVPILVGVGLRGGVGIAAGAVFFAALFTVGVTVAGHGPFADPAAGLVDRALAAQTFMVAVGLSAFGPTALVAERRRTAEALARSEARLIERETQLHEALRAGGVFAFVWDVATDEVWRSDTCSAILGLPAAIAGRDSGSGFFARVHPDDRAAFVTLVTGLRPERPNFVAQYRYLRPDGDVAWLEETGAADFDADGRLAAVRGMTTDITVRRVAEERARATRATLHDALIAAKAGTWEWDGEARRATLSEEAFDLFGIDPAQGFSSLRAWRDRFVHPDDRALLDPRRLLAQEEFTVEYRVMHPTRGLRWILGQGRVDDPRAPRRVMGINIDVTARREAEDALRATTERLQLAEQAAAFGIYDLDVASGVSVWSARLREIAGIDAERLTEDAVLALVHPDDRARVEAHVRLTLDASSDEPRQTSFRLVRPDGGVRWVVDVGRAFRGGAPDGGPPTRVVGTIVDVTDRHEAEERQRLLTREVDHRARNLLAIVQSMLRLTHADSVSAFVVAAEGRIAALARAHTLLSQSRWEGADVGTLVAEELAAWDCDGPRAHRLFAVGPDVALTPSAAQAFAMALHELAVNAAKHGALSVPEGRLDVRWGLARDRLSLDWAETGGPLVHGPPTRRGFGTTVLEATIEHQLDGTTTLDWTPAGLRCRIEVPGSHVVPARPAKAPEATRVGPPRGAALEGRRVLVVEDESVLAMGVVRALAAAGGVVVGPVARVTSALSLVNDPLDVAVLDLNLRGESSLPVAEALLSRGIPIVFATGYDTAFMPEPLRGAPVLHKPITDAALVEAVARALRL